MNIYLSLKWENFNSISESRNKYVIDSVRKKYQHHRKYTLSLYDIILSMDFKYTIYIYFSKEIIITFKEK